MQRYVNQNITRISSYFLSTLPDDNLTDLYHLHHPCSTSMDGVFIGNYEIDHGIVSSNPIDTDTMRLILLSGICLLRVTNHYTLLRWTVNSPSWIRGSTQMGEGVRMNTQAKVSNSSVFNCVKSTSSYPRGGVY